MVTIWLSFDFPDFSSLIVLHTPQRRQASISEARSWLGHSYCFRAGQDPIRRLVFVALPDADSADAILSTEPRCRTPMPCAPTSTTLGAVDSFGDRELLTRSVEQKSGAGENPTTHEMIQAKVITRTPFPRASGALRRRMASCMAVKN